LKTQEERNGGAMKRGEKIGSHLKPVSENAATVAYVADMLKELEKEIVKIDAARAAHPEYLSVLDAWTENEFLENARQVYRAAHLPNRMRGRRSEENSAIGNLIVRSHELGRKLTRGEMTKLLIHLKLSKNTASKYARLYYLSKQEIAGISQVDQKWLCKEFGIESPSEAWWEEKCWNWWLALGTSTGAFDDTRNLYHNP
jgi:hypothetical protein